MAPTVEIKCVGRFSQLHLQIERNITLARRAPSERNPPLVSQLLGGDKSQSVEQAGFRSGFSTVDHLFTVVSLCEWFQERREPLWVAAVDYEKAFDSI